MQIIICVILWNNFEIETYPITMCLNFVVQFIAGFLCGLLALASILLSSYSQATNGEFRLRWNAQQGGYWCHVTSAISEWVAINANSVFMLCLYARMKRFHYWAEVWQPLF